MRVDKLVIDRSKSDVYSIAVVSGVSHGKPCCKTVRFGDEIRLGVDARSGGEGVRRSDATFGIE